MAEAVADRRSRRSEQILAAAWQLATEEGLGAVTLHEVARRVGIKQPSLYGYVSSKLDLFDLMFRQAYEQLLERLDADPPEGSAREQLLRLSRIVLDFVVENPPRQQLLFQRTIPGFEPSPASYALAVRLVDRTQALMAAMGKGTDAHVEALTAVISGLGGQQIANDPGGDRWVRHLENMLGIVLDHFHPQEQS